MSWLTSILGGVGSVVAAPFTGGASLAALPGLIGSAAGGAAKGSADQRTAETNYGLQRDTLGLNASRTNEQALEERARLELMQKQLAQQTQQTAFQNALRSSLAKNWTPAARPSGASNISFVGKGIGPEGHAATDAIYNSAMTRLLDGEKFTDLPAYTPYMLASPEKMAGPSTTEKILGILGIGGKLVGGLMDANKGRYDSQGE